MSITNKGHGAGGANTNLTGLSFEKESNIQFKIIDVLELSEKVLFEYKNTHYQLHCLKKTTLFKYMKYIQEFDVNIHHAHGCKQPDECYVEESKKILFVIEKKNQNVSGSVCEKIQTAPFKLYHYKKCFPNYKIHYLYCLSEWFRNHTKAELEYLTDMKIPYFFFNDKYIDSIQRYIYEILQQNEVQEYVNSKELLKVMPNVNGSKVKPILKWLGGKSQLIDDISPNIPKNIQGNYIEPFVGGGAVLLHVLQNCSVSGKIIASDSNLGLISMYKNIQSHPELVYNYLEQYSQNYLKSPSSNKKNGGGKTNIQVPDDETSACQSQEIFYYWLRNRFNELQKTNQYDSYEYSALFILINKTCFRGLYREGPNGFNVPFGNYKKVSLPSLSEIRNFSNLIQNVVFKYQDFQDAFQDLNCNDFIYVDPPYYPETKTSFVKYTKDGFDKHDKLFDVLLNTQSNFLMSNSNVDCIHELFSDTCHIKIVDAKRHINSKNPGAKTKEVLVSKK